MPYEVEESKRCPGEWIVEAIKGEEIEFVLFSGPQAKERAEEYAAMKNKTTSEGALATLKAAFKADPHYAWTWHCALAVSATDEGMERQAANQAAARFMKMAFDVDTSKKVY